MAEQLRWLLGADPAPSVVVIGDLILDEYLLGRVERLSPEAPVPVVESSRSTFALGGAANVANNLRALGCRVRSCGVAGADEGGARLRSLLAAAGIDAAGVITDPGRRTTQKTRVIARGHQVLRIDREDTEPVSAAIADALSKAAGDLTGASALVCSDYRKGVLGAALLGRLLAAAAAAGVPAVIDPKGRDYGRYRGATALTPNLNELQLATGVELRGASDPALCGAAASVLEATGAGAVLVTCGAEGVVLCRPGREPLVIPARAREVFDITGAGDTVVAAFTRALVAGAGLEEAAWVANVAGGIAVGRLGTTPVAREELLAHVAAESGEGRPHGISAAPTARTTPASSPSRRGAPSSEPGNVPGPGMDGKRLDLEALTRALAAERARGARIVCTNGCFELLHAGHVAYLSAARSHGDVLVVGLNSDASVRRIKGPERPLVGQEERAAVLAALDSVSYVTIFDEDTPAAFIERVQPDVLVKGADWAPDQVVGRDVVEARGGRLELIPLVPGASTSAIIETVLARYGKGDRDA